MAIDAVTQDSTLVRLINISKEYHVAAGHFSALKDVNLEIRRGECVAVVGKSGSGKTTLINLLTGIDSPTAGELEIDGRSIHRMSQEELAVWRGRTVGIVFQFFQLLPTLTVLENIMLPMDFCNTFPAAKRRPRALGLLERMGIADQAGKLPADLSGGQQQRAAIARALANDPPIVVADEPTGNLDSSTADDVLGFLSALSQDGKTVLTVTHERDVSHFFTRTITLHDGSVEMDSAGAAP
jgi:putative ABC transport system ATP-binding protein